VVVINCYVGSIVNIGGAGIGIYVDGADVVDGVDDVVVVVVAVCHTVDVRSVGRVDCIGGLRCCAY